MLENFTDEEIAEELLATGELFPKDRMDDRRIERNARFVNGLVTGHVVAYLYERASSCDRRRQDYRSLKELLLCESMTFDILRKDWRYHGVLLGSPGFCEKLVHDSGCWCGKCTGNLTICKQCNKSDLPLNQQSGLCVRCAIDNEQATKQRGE